MAVGDKVEYFKKPARKIDRVFIHCTASSNPDVDAKTVQRWHVDGNGWSDIGYHYLITTKGELQEGRHLESTPAAQKGNNTGTIAICLNGLHLEDFNESQFLVLSRLCDQIDAAYGHDITFHGHREVAAKACPVFDYKSVLELTEDGHLPS